MKEVREKIQKRKRSSTSNITPQPVTSPEGELVNQVQPDGKYVQPGEEEKDKKRKRQRKDKENKASVVGDSDSREVELDSGHKSSTRTSSVGRRADERVPKSTRRFNKHLRYEDVESAGKGQQKKLKHKRSKSEQYLASPSTQAKVLGAEGSREDETDNVEENTEDGSKEVIVTQVKQVDGQWVVQPTKVVVKKTRKIETPVPPPVLYNLDVSPVKFPKRGAKTPRNRINDPSTKHTASEVSEPAHTKGSSSAFGKTQKCTRCNQINSKSEMLGSNCVTCDNTSNHYASDSTTPVISRKRKRELKRLRLEEMEDASRELERVVARITKSASNNVHRTLVERCIAGSSQIPASNIENIETSTKGHWQDGKIRGSRPNSNDEETVENVAFSPAFVSRTEGITFSSAESTIKTKTITLQDKKSNVELGFEQGGNGGGIKICTVMNGTFKVELGKMTFEIKQGGVWRIRGGETCVVRLAASSERRGELNVTTVQ